MKTFKSQDQKQKFKISSFFNKTDRSKLPANSATQMFPSLEDFPTFTVTRLITWSKPSSKRGIAPGNPTAIFAKNGCDIMFITPSSEGLVSELELVELDSYVSTSEI